jgi:hypothetical protein
MIAAGKVHQPIATAQRDRTEARALADALAQLLARDDELPACWLAPAFADAVGRARAEQHAGAPGHGSPDDLVAAGPLTFPAAVSQLACDPRRVALAIRQLEIAGARCLPPWPELMRRRMPTPPTIVDVSLWFG